MPRQALAVPAAVLAALALAAPAAARSFTVSTAGNKPDVAVDGGGTAHVVWDTVDAGGTSTTHYCRVLHSASGCAAGSEKTFAPRPGDRDFAGPRVFLPGGGRVVVVTSRCCSSDPGPGPDGQFHGTHVYRFLSGDGGANFDAGAVIGGTQTPDLAAAYAPGDTILAMGIAAGGVGIAGMPLNGFTGATNTIAPTLAISGGIGVAPSAAVAAFSDRSSVYAAQLTGDPNAAGAWPVKRIASGGDVRVTSGPKGPDLFYRVGSAHARYVVRRRSSKGTFGRAITVSETGYPIFGNASQDPKGRIHAAWIGTHGLTYRVSSTSGRSFGRMRTLSTARRLFNLVVASDARNRAVVVYDSNAEAGKVGGYTAG
jgi:hypothetical protein